MNNLIHKISKPIEDDLVKFNAFFKKNLSSDVNIINSVINYMIKTKGKQYRTILCLLCSRITNKEPNDLSFLSASSVEALHIATLLHDDVVDDSNIRRGWPTINKIWKNKLSILIGDYLFSKVLINISKFNDLHSIGILSDISKRLSEGEIFQIEKAINKEMSEKEYLKMISDKTASLISSACYLGFYSNNKDKVAGKKIKDFGEYLGLAYQIKDDVFDIVGNINDTGKKSNLDVKKNMLTLPYIYSISKLSNRDKKSFLLQIKKYVSKKNMEGIKNMIVDSGGIDYAMAKINHFSKMAIAELDDFPESEYKKSLISAVEFNVNRKY